MKHHINTYVLCLVLIVVPLMGAIVFVDIDSSVKRLAGDQEHISLVGYKNNEISSSLTASDLPPSFFIDPLQHSSGGFIRKKDFARNRAYDAHTVFALHLKSGQVLYSFNDREVRPIASITKLMAALVIVENIDVEQRFQVSLRATQVSGKTVGLKYGQWISVHDALYAALLESGNDSVVALEDYYRSRFSQTLVQAMNQKAQDLGLFRTSFVEPTGLSARNVSNAYEVTQLLKNVFLHPYLRTILSSYMYDASYDVWYNTNFLLDNEHNKTGWREKGIIAGKTGYTEDAGQSISLLGVTASDDEVLMVVLDAKANRILVGRSLWRWVQESFVWDAIK